MYLFKLSKISAVIVILFFCCSFSKIEKNLSLEYYQLTVYHCKTEQQLLMASDYLKNVYLPALHHFGLSNIGVFVAINNDTAVDKKLYLIIPFGTIQKYEKFSNELTAGSLIKDKSSPYINAPHNSPSYDRMEIIFLKSFKMMPRLKTPSLKTPLSERVYELRSYESSTERLKRQKIHMFNEGGEIKLFEKLHFNAVFYSEVLSGDRIPNLMYMTTFNNKSDRDQHWKNFSSDSTWKRISTLPEYLNTVSKADISFLRPTDFSDF